MQKHKGIIGIIIAVITMIVALFIPASPIYLLSGAGATDSSVVINLTWNDNITDDRALRHDWSSTGVTYTDSDDCKWYGCANFTATSGDYLSSTTNFSMDSDMSICYWIKPTSTPTGGDSMFTMDMGVRNTPDYLTIGEGDYGTHINFRTITNTLDVGEEGESTETRGGIWTHYCYVYDSVNTVIYKNGETLTNDSTPYGDINYTDGQGIRIGLGIYDINFVGLMDEFLFYNSSLTKSEVVSLYDAQKTGTPPELDIIMSSLSVNESLIYKYDFSTVNNSLNLSGNIPFVINLTNKGSNNSASFNTTITWDDVYVCSLVTSLLAGSYEEFPCNIPKSEGFHSLEVFIDINNDLVEDYEDNNNYSEYIDFRAHPVLVSEINLTYINANTNTPAYDSKDWHDSFLADDFSSGWTADDIDPRAKKGYENSLNCYINGYNSVTACQRARNHLEGWLNGTISASDYATDTSVQETHEVEWLGKNYDIMFNNLTLEEAIVYAAGLKDICLSLFGQTNVRPDNDGLTLNPDNGQGFYIGAAAVCSVVLGDDVSNPSVIYTNEQDYNPVNTNYHWFRRMNGHVAASQGDSGALEGLLYQNYANYHILWSLFYDQQTDLFGTANNYGREIGGRAEYYLYTLLDTNSSGSSVYGDDSNNAKFISFGDSHSYDSMGEMSVIGGSLLSAMGYLSGNDTTRSSSLYIRNHLYDYGNSAEIYGRPTEDLFYYPLLDLSVDAFTESEVQDNYGFVFEDSMDNFYLRNGFSYDAEDVVRVFYGGQKSGWGHPNAEWDLFSYFKGVSFSALPQVPYNDDVRSERWHNTMSLSNSTSSGYISVLGSTPLDQHYGGANTCLLTEYPDCDYQPVVYSGNVSDYFGTMDGLLGGLSSFQPYDTTDSVPEQRLLFINNTVLRCYFVDRTGIGKLQFNHLNLDVEVNGSIDGTTLNLQGIIYPDRNYQISVLNSTVALSLEGGNSTVRASKSKTDLGLNAYYNHWNHYSDSADDETVCFTEQAYISGNKQTLTKITSGNDLGILVNGVSALIDTEDDGVSYGGFTTDGWGLTVLNSTHVALNGATYLDNGTDNVSLLSTPFSGVLLATGEEDVTPPVISSVNNASTTNISSSITWVTNENANSSVDYGTTSSLGTFVESGVLTTSHSLGLTGLIPNTLYYYNVSSCDSSGNCAENGLNNFTTDDNVIVPPISCSYSSYLNLGLVQTCLPSGCTFDGLGCYFNLSTTGFLEVRT